MYKRAKLNDIYEDYIVFRELNPIKKSLPQFNEIQSKLGFSHLPRKKENPLDYVKALSYIFQSVRPFQKILYIGDTNMSDGGVIKAFTALRTYQIVGIITQEEKENKIEFEGNIVKSTKWMNMKHILKMVEDNGFHIDYNTVVIIDIDKTFIGARGRNDKAIDNARMDAIISIAKKIFPSFDRETFSQIYSTINAKKFYPLTNDNQDIVSIISIVIYSGAISLKQFEKAFELGIIKNPISFFGSCKIKNELLENIVENVKNNIKMKNPTPFPTFRNEEFKSTIERMDFLTDNTPKEKLLKEEIMITKEVYEVGEIAKMNKAVVFGVSDKPILSSVPKVYSLLKPIYEKETKLYPV